MRNMITALCRKKIMQFGKKIFVFFQVIQVPVFDLPELLGKVKAFTHFGSLMQVRVELPGRT